MRNDHIVIMGVSGCGKSTVGALVARSLSRAFIEGDDYHPPENRAKMAGGQALENADREVWIADICGAANADPPAIIACSALNLVVRQWLRQGLSRPARFVFLTARESILAQRLSQRRRHFFDPALLRSQLDALEPPMDAIKVRADQDLESIIAQIMAALDND